MRFKITEVNEEDFRRIMIVGTYLNEWQGLGDDGIQKVFEQQRMVQFDPLNPAGRNHDLFFAARVPNYRKSQFEKLMYTEKQVFEAYFPNLFAIHMDHFPLFQSRMKEKFLHSYYKTRIKKLQEDYPGVFEQILEFIRTNGPTNSNDLAHLGTVDRGYRIWKSGRLAGNVLEFLWQLGQIMIVGRDESFRKIYDLEERYVSPDMSLNKDFTEEEHSLQSFKLKQKYYPLMSVGRISQTKKGTLSIGKKKLVNPEWIENGTIEDVLKFGTIGYVVVPNWEEFLECETDNEMRALGPLDPLIYDRDFIKKIFHFDYNWEVYKKPKDRIWGYYVYPLLYQGNLIGRMEAKYDKKTSVLQFFNLNLEDGFNLDDEGKNSLFRMLERWKDMISSDSILLDTTFPN